VQYANPLNNMTLGFLPGWTITAGPSYRENPHQPAVRDDNTIYRAIRIIPARDVSVIEVGPGLFLRPERGEIKVRRIAISRLTTK
jgi:hypothetical protein